MLSPMLALFCLATCVKLLLMPSYRSTDFEVHRSWMALTSSKPLAVWYTDETSQWTLDYPPLFAWFECALAVGAPFFDEQMLVPSAAPYESAATVTYQRLTVILTDAVLLAGCVALTRAAAADSNLRTHDLRHSTAVALTFLNAGLLLVDHVHFQYNGMLIGLLLLSIACIHSEKPLAGAVLFAVLLNMKHLFLFAAPLYFVYLLRTYVLRGQPPSAAAFRRLCVLGAAVAAVFAISLGPFIALDQLPQLGRRLFPFGRGLTHAYWAPNVWALYTFADRVLAAARARLLGSQSLHSGAAGATSGMVGEVAMAVLPDVRAGHTAMLALLSQMPILVATWRAPRAAAFAPAVACCGLSTFLLGYHVHEKALLPPLLVLTSLSPTGRAKSARLHARLLVILT
jgi:alpha-1,3-glucosyltransferase